MRLYVRSMIRWNMSRNQEIVLNYRSRAPANLLSFGCLLRPMGRHYLTTERAGSLPDRSQFISHHPSQLFLGITFNVQHVLHVLSLFIQPSSCTSIKSKGEVSYLDTEPLLVKENWYINLTVFLTANVSVYEERTSHTLLILMLDDGFMVGGGRGKKRNLDCPFTKWASSFYAKQWHHCGAYTHRPLWNQTKLQSTNMWF